MHTPNADSIPDPAPSQSRRRYWSLRDSLKWASLTDAIRSDSEAVLFSLKCFAAAVLALYVSSRIGLTRPFWALGTVYFVSQPLSGMSGGRGLYRFLGTVIGAVVTVLMVPTFVNEPLALSAAIASWMGFCLYIARLGRTPRAYAFQLAGYTTSMIGFPYAMNAGAIFTVTSILVQEVTVGILCATLVHALILPRKMSYLVQTRIAIVLADSERWTRHMLDMARDVLLASDRARSAVDMLDLHQLSTHLPFDTVRGSLQSGILRVFQRRLLAVLSLSGAIDDTLAELRELSHDVPTRLVSLFEQVRAWLDIPEKITDLGASETLLQRLHQHRTGVSTHSSWHDFLIDRLLSHLADLILAHQDCRLLEQRLKRTHPRWNFDLPERLLGSRDGYVLHRDHWLAARSAIGAAIGIAISCALWIWTSWSDGATAVSLVGASCALFGMVDQPVDSLIRYVVGSIVGIAVGLVYGFVIFPRTIDFASLVAAFSPALLITCSMLARPQYSLAALGVALTFPVIAGLGPTNASDLSGAANDVIAFSIGLLMAVASVNLFQTIGISHSASRILRAIRRDVARRATGRATEVNRWTSQLVDRISLLVPRLAGDSQSSYLLRQALADLRTGNTVGELWTLEKQLRNRKAKSCVATFLDELAAYFRQPEAPGVGNLIGWLDTAMIAVAADTSPASVQALSLLTDLRRDLLVRAIPQDK
jgi:uncharacterized membrane protein YccC